MNKLFTKIAGVTLGFAMAIGVGVAVVGKQEVKAAKAATVGDTYNAVTNVDQLESGDSLLIVSESYNKVLGTTQNTNNRNAVASGTITNHSLSYATGMQEITLGGSTGQWTLTAGSVRLSGVSGKNYLKNGTDTWTIAINTTSFEATITSAASSRIIMYNSNNDIFATYSSTQQSVQIYKKASSFVEVDTTSITLGDPTFETGASANDFYVGNYFDIAATLSAGSTSKVVWSVVNTSTATATLTPAQDTLSTRVTATGEGSLTIKAQAVKSDGTTEIANMSATYNITVKANVITGITYTGTPVEQFVGEKFDPIGLSFFYTRTRGTDSTPIDVNTLTFNNGENLSDNQTQVVVKDASNNSGIISPITVSRCFVLDYDNLLTSEHIYAKTDGVQQATWNTYTEIKFVKNVNAAMTISAKGITKIVVDQSNTYPSNMSFYFGLNAEGTEVSPSAEVTTGKASWIIGHQYEYTFENGTDFAYLINGSTYDVNYYSIRVYYTGTLAAKAIAIDSGSPKTSYTETDLFDMNGATVAAYRDALKTEKMYNLPAGVYSISKTTALETTDTSITISYETLSFDIAITVASKVVLTSIEINEPASTVLEMEDELQLTVTVNEGASSEVVWSTSNSEIATVGESTGLVTAVAPGKVTITATGTNGTETTADDLSDTIELTVNNWTNVDFVDGAEYLLAATGSYTTSGKTYNYDIEFAGVENNLGSDANHVAYYSCVNLLTIEYASQKDTFYLKFNDGQDDLYLGYSSKKSLSAYEEKTSATIWTLTKGNDGVVTIADSTASSCRLQYNPNNGNGRFAVYDSTQKPVKLIHATDSVKLEARAEEFINAYMHPEISTDNRSEGTACYGTDGTDGYFGLAKAALEKAKSEGGYVDCVAQFAASGDMWDRYVAWGAACKIEVSFVDSTITYSSGVRGAFSSEDSNEVAAIVVIIAIASISAFGCLLILKKRKHQ